jgi:hypothetical protein
MHGMICPGQTMSYLNNNRSELIIFRYYHLTVAGDHIDEVCTFSMLHPFFQRASLKILKCYSLIYLALSQFGRIQLTGKN